MNEHVHLLVKIKLTMSISDFVRDLRSGSSKWTSDVTNKIFAWQRRYGAFTVSESQFKVVQNYIRNQEIHHAKFDFKYEFEGLIKANNLLIDEYLWKD